MGTSLKTMLSRLSVGRQARIKAGADRVVAFDASLRDRLQSLVAGVDIDLDAPLSPDDE